MGISDDPTCKSITISSEEKPQLYALIESIKDDDSQIKRLMAYYNKIRNEGLEIKKGAIKYGTIPL
ncbi:hypothetical protein [Butyrivibrio sp. MC2013]|uniref:hypothetical protein n=1 Tax=Butyrivibrio sp. MC2013 TaxID=1280686 RepID=UPI0018CB495A|nr:hypothetical protein [Butyrivibrio sp. MC2013]